MKKIISFIFVLCLISAAFTVSAFDDMPNDWSTKALQSAVDNGLLQGSDNKLLPKDNLTRAQMATILVRAFGADEKGDISSFTDVKASSWYHSYMAISYKMQLFKGDGAGKLNPDAYITREEAFLVLSRSFSLSASTTSGLAKFSDGNQVSSWAREGLEALVTNGYVSGSNGKLNPKANITRAEFAQVMYNLIQAYVDTPEELLALGEIDGNVIVRGDAIKAIDNVKIKGDLIIGDGVPEGFSFNNVKIDGRLVVRASAEFKFDGNVNELVVASENSFAVISKDSTVNKVTIPSSTSSFEVEGEESSNTGGSTPGGSYNPDSQKPVVEDDIWTNFQ